MTQLQTAQTTQVTPEPLMMRATFWRRYRKNGPAVVAMAAMIVIFVIGMGYWVAHVNGWYWPADPIVPNTVEMLRAPSLTHPLGTDDLGRDVLARILLGAHVSLMIGFVAVSISVIIGTILGATAGYFRGWVDDLIMRFVDMMMCIPQFFLILTVVAIAKPNIWYVAGVIGLVSWMNTARLVRAEFLTLREMDYVQAARALGARHVRIIFRHILPNALPPVFVTAVLGVSGAILTEASLSYLGFGVQPPDPSWGNIISSGRQYILDAWWLIVFPGVAIFLTTMAFYVTGEGMRIALDPKETKQI